MPGLKKRSYARYTRAAAGLMGQLIGTQRIERRMTLQEFADRHGVGRGTVQLNLR